MRSSRAILAVFALVPLAVWACGEDEYYYEDVPTDAGPTTKDAGKKKDAAAPVTCGDASGVPPRALVLQGGTNTAELAAINFETHEIDGRLTFDGGYGFTSSIGNDPWFVSGVTNEVIRLDAREPWKAIATWNVAGDDALTAEDTNANPVAVIPTSCTKAYVLRFNRNKIAVIDPSDEAGGEPTTFIDLEPLQVKGDTGPVDMTAGVYIPKKKLVYVLLGNVDLTKTVTANGTTKLVCATTKPSIITIDPEKDEVVGDPILLEGYNPPIGSPLIYDEANDRLLVLEGGCNADVGDGGPGDMTRRRVEAVSLANGAVTTLAALDDKGFPSSLALADESHAAVAFYFDGYPLNAASGALGAKYGDQVDVVAVDGKGAFFGARAIFADNAPTKIEVFSIAVDGQPATIATDPFTKAGGSVSSIEAWPHP